LGPIGGFHAAGFLAALGFVLAAAQVLQAAQHERPVWSLALVLSGGGLGWLRWSWGAEAWRLVDLSTTLFPWNQRLAGGPHALLGSGLFLFALHGFVLSRRGGARLRWLLPASLLGLVRPFDLGLFAVTAAVVVGWEAASDPGWWRSFVRGTFELAALLPVLFYDWLAFAWHPSFAPWSGGQNSIASPGAIELASALGPAAALAVAGSRRPAPSAAAAQMRRALWASAACMLALSQTATFGFQFLNSLGGVVLVLAALAVPGRYTPFAVAALAPSSLVLLWQAFNPSPVLFPPRDYRAAVEVLESRCQPGDALIAPIDLSLLVAGLTPCHVVLGHWVLTPEREARGRESERFYDPNTSAAWRRAYLGAVEAAYVALPAGRGEWLAGCGLVPLLATPMLEIWGQPPAARAGAERPPRHAEANAAP
jgi:hypothetical protein